AAWRRPRTAPGTPGSKARALEIGRPGRNKGSNPSARGPRLHPFFFAPGNPSTTLMRMDKLTSKLQMALADAQSLAVGQDHQFIEPVHLMVALLDQQGSSVRGLLTKAGVNVNLLRSQLGEAMDRLPRVEGTGGDVHVSNDLNRLLNLTDSLAQKRNDQYISSELVVLAARDDRSPRKPIREPAGAGRGGVWRPIDELRRGQAARA